MQEIYLLDWIKIMDMAIKGRPTSWGERPIQEWRNASDEVLMALMDQCREGGIFSDTIKEARDELLGKLKTRRARKKIVRKGILSKLYE